MLILRLLVSIFYRDTFCYKANNTIPKCGNFVWLLPSTLLPGGRQHTCIKCQVQLPHFDLPQCPQMLLKGIRDGNAGNGWERERERRIGNGTLCQTPFHVVFKPLEEFRARSSNEIRSQLQFNVTHQGTCTADTFKTRWNINGTKYNNSCMRSRRRRRACHWAGRCSIE